MGEGVGVSMEESMSEGVGASMRASAHLSAILLQARMKISK